MGALLSFVHAEAVQREAREALAAGCGPDLELTDFDADALGLRLQADPTLRLALVASPPSQLVALALREAKDVGEAFATWRGGVEEALRLQRANRGRTLLFNAGEVVAGDVEAGVGHCLAYANAWLAASPPPDPRPVAAAAPFEKIRGVAELLVLSHLHRAPDFAKLADEFVASAVPLVEAHDERAAAASVGETVQSLLADQEAAVLAASVAKAECERLNAKLQEAAAEIAANVELLNLQAETLAQVQRELEASQSRLESYIDGADPIRAGAMQNESMAGALRAN